MALHRRGQGSQLKVSLDEGQEKKVWENYCKSLRKARLSPDIPRSELVTPSSPSNIKAQQEQDNEYHQEHYKVAHGNHR